MYFDSTYLLYMIPALLFTLIAQGMVKSRFAKYSAVMSRRGCTGAEAARRILDANRLSGVQVTTVEGSLTDHYDPRAKVIRLSRDVYSNSSVASIGVAAHEAGHAIQHQEGYFPLSIRNAVIPVCQLGSQLAMPLFLLGLLFSFTVLMKLGIVCFAAAVVFQIITLPVEFNASRRALAILEREGILYDDELNGARKVLTAAAMTYVAAMAAALAQLLRLIALSQRRGRR